MRPLSPTTSYGRAPSTLSTQRCAGPFALTDCRAQSAKSLSGTTCGTAEACNCSSRHPCTYTHRSIALCERSDELIAALPDRPKCLVYLPTCTIDALGPLRAMVCTCNLLGAGSARMRGDSAKPLGLRRGKQWCAHHSCFQLSTGSLAAQLPASIYIYIYMYIYIYTHTHTRTHAPWFVA